MIRSFVKKLRPKQEGFLYSGKDLFQEGVCGLIEAHNKYDKNKAKFITYAYIRVKGSIIDYIRKQEWRPMSKVKEKTGYDTIHASSLSENEWYNLEKETKEEAKELFEHLSFGLNKREKDIAYKLFVLNYTQERIAKSIGLTLTRVNQIVNGPIYRNFANQYDLLYNLS